MQSDDMLAEEIRIFIDTLDGITSVVTSDHIMNLLENVTGKLPEDKEKMLVNTGDIIDDDVLKAISDHKVKSIEFIPQVRDPIILTTLQQDISASHEEAILKIYMRLRPGSPPHKEKAMDLFRRNFSIRTSTGSARWAGSG